MGRGMRRKESGVSDSPPKRPITTPESWGREEQKIPWIKKRGKGGVIKGPIHLRESYLEKRP